MPYGKMKLLVVAFGQSVLVVWPPAPRSRGWNQRCLPHCGLVWVPSCNSFWLFLDFSDILLLSHHVFMGWPYISHNELKHMTDKIIIPSCESYHMFSPPSTTSIPLILDPVILPFLHHPLYATKSFFLVAIYFFPSNALCFQWWAFILSTFVLNE